VVAPNFACSRQNFRRISSGGGTPRSAHPAKGHLPAGQRSGGGEALSAHLHLRREAAERVDDAHRPVAPIAQEARIELPMSSTEALKRSTERRRRPGPDGRGSVAEIDDSLSPKLTIVSSHSFRSASDAASFTGSPCRAARRGSWRSRPSRAPASGGPLPGGLLQGLREVWGDEQSDFHGCLLIMLAHLHNRFFAEWEGESAPASAREGAGSGRFRRKG